MLLPQFYLKFNKDNSWHMDRPHFHEDVEFLLPVSSGDEIFVENDIYPLTPGVMFVLPDATLHKTLASNPYERYVLHVPTQVLSRLSTTQTDFLKQIRKSEYIIQLGEKTPYYIQLLQRLERAHESCGNGFGEDMEQFLLFHDFSDRNFIIGKNTK